MRIINNHIVFEPKPNESVGVYPECKYAEANGISYCAVPFTYDYTRLLRNMGHMPPDTIRYQYDWPGTFTPYEHQKETAAFLTRHHRAYILSGMGVMKTISALWAAEYLMRIGATKKVLVVAPLSTLDPVWGNEIFRHLWKRKFTILHGTADKRKALLKQDSDFYIVNHDGVEILASELSRRKDIDLYIIDEAAKYRNRGTNKWKVMSKLLSPEKRAWGLTGTPTPNEPPDAYGIARLITPESCIYTYREFRLKTMTQITQYKWAKKPQAEAVVNQILSPSIRYTLEECVDLPEQIYHERQVRLSTAQETVIKQLEYKALSEVGDHTITAVNAAVLINKIVQTACGIVYSHEGTVTLDYTERYKVLEECIEQAAAKVIVFVPYTIMLKGLEEKLSKRWSIAIIDGSVSLNNRNKIFKDFQDSAAPHVLLANPEAMSHGLTLTAADTIIWYAPIHSGETYPQANARIKRPGQKRVTNIVHIFATPTERKIYSALKDKKSFQDLVLALIKTS